MRDLAGFAILLLAIVLLFYLIGEVVLPFVVRYLLGVVVFFALATALVLKGRLHPVHLEGLLRPGVPAVLAVGAVAIPLAHALAAYLFGGVDLWWVLFIVNATFPVLWTARLLITHRRQKRLYVSEGHDIEDFLSRIRARETTLEVLADAIESASRRPVEPTPWERAVGLGPLGEVGDPQVVRELRGRLEELRGKYGVLASELTQALAEIRAGRTLVPGPTSLRAQQTFAALHGPFEDVRERASALLAEVTTGIGISRWEDSFQR